MFDIFIYDLDDGKNAPSASLQMLENCEEYLIHQMGVPVQRDFDKLEK